MHTNIICKIERYNQSSGLADLEPLFLDDAGNALPIIKNARVTKLPDDPNPSYVRGQTVLACITERDFADAVAGRKGNGDSTGKYELTSAVVIGVIA